MTRQRQFTLLWFGALLAISSALAAQTAPTIDAIPDPAAILEDAGAQNVGLSGITDGDSGTQTLTVTATSDNTALIPDPTVNYTSPDSTGSLDYTPVADASGSAVITVTVTDDGTEPNSTQETFTVTVTAVDDPPVAVADVATVAEDAAAAAIGVLANDTDIDGGPKTIDSATDPAGGTVVVAVDGLSLTYEPDADFCNDGSPTDDFTYTLTEGGSTATVAVTVNCVDDAPVAVDDAATVDEDDPATSIDVLANDTDVDGGPKTIASATDPAGGTVVVAVDGLSLTYEPDADFCNDGSPTDDFTYTLTEGGSTATVAVTVNCVDDAPVAVDDAATVDEDAAATTIDVLANDTDIDGGPKTIASATDPAGGTVVVALDGLSLTYQPDADFCNTTAGTTDDFSYTLSPGGSSATVAVTVDCAPDAADDVAMVDEDSSNNAIDVLANDDTGDPTASVTAVTQPTNGAATANGADVLYTPNADYCNTTSGTTDDFTYTVTDGDGDTDTATVSVTVDCSPDAVDDAATVAEDSANNPIDVLANDDTGDPTASVTAVTQPANGSATANGADVSYTPNPDFCNSTSGTTDDFTYTVTDADGDADTATVQVTVNCAPDAIDDTATVFEDSVDNAIDVLANDELGDPTATVTAVTDPANGTATANGSNVLYTPDADYCDDGSPTDDFIYTVTDGDGSTDTASVSVSVTCINDEPSFTAGADESIFEDAGPQTASGWATDISAGPANESGQALVFNITGNTNPGLFAAAPAVDAGTGDLTYTVNADASGSADITIELMDDGGTANGGDDTSPAVVLNISVTDINDAPTFTSGGDVITEAGTGEQLVPWATNVSVGPINESTQTPSFVTTLTDCNPSPIATGPTVDADGTLRFTPVDGATGICSATVKLTDDGGTANGGVNESPEVSFTIELVTATRPVADSQSVSAGGFDELGITLTGSDPDDQTPLEFQVLEPVADQDTGEIISDSGPFRGTLDTTTPPANPDGVSADVIYTPNELVHTKAVLGIDSVVVEKFADILSGDVLVNSVGGSLTIERSTSTPAGFAIKADSIDVDSTAAVNGDAFCNGGNFAANCDPLAVPVYDLLPPFRVGDVDDTNDVSLPNGATQNLTPGIYGDISVGRNAILTFASGNYSMRSLTVDSKGALEFSGETEVKIAERLVTDSNAHINGLGSASDVTFFVAGDDLAGSAAEIGFNNADFRANVYAANGTIDIGQDSAVTGAFIGKNVVVGSKATVTLDSAFAEVQDQFAFEVVDQFGLVSDEAVVEINPDDSCRDDAGLPAAIAAFAGSAETDGEISIQITLAGCESTDVPVTFALVQDGAEGDVTGLPSGPVSPPYEFDVTYAPDVAGPNERDNFIFSISNGISTVQATVEVNEPPCDSVEASTSISSVATDENNPLTVTLSGCDPEDDALAFSTDPASGGTFVDCASCDISAPTVIVDNRPGFSSANVVITHNEVVSTATSFEYTVTSTSGSASATIGVEVNPLNLAPVANDDAFVGSLGGVITGNVLDNDTDVNLDALTATLVSGPSSASNFELNPDGTFVYTHNGLANFTDSFDYSASDGSLSDSATVSISIVAANITVTVSKVGSGAAESSVFSDPAGIDCGPVCSAMFMTTLPIRLDVVPAPGFVFAFWSGDADCVDGEITPIADRTCVANFETDTTPPPSGDPVLVTIVKTGSGSGTVTSAPVGIDCGAICSATITGDPRIVLTGTADPGSVFEGFFGGPGGDDCNDGELEAADDTTCSAVFTAIDQTLTLDFVGTAGGIVVSTPSGINCTDDCSADFETNATVTLSARPDSGDPDDVTWGGACATDPTFPNKATVVMSADATCTVSFD